MLIPQPSGMCCRVRILLSLGVMMVSGLDGLKERDGSIHGGRKVSP